MTHIFNKCFEKVLVLTTNYKIFEQSEQRRKGIILKLEDRDVNKKMLHLDLI